MLLRTWKKLHLTKEIHAYEESVLLQVYRRVGISNNGIHSGRRIFEYSLSYFSVNTVVPF